jgi:hypothetical protein
MKFFPSKLLYLMILLLNANHLDAATVSGTVGYPSDTDTAALSSGSTIFVYLDMFNSGGGYIAGASLPIGVPASTLTSPFSIDVPTSILGQTPVSYSIRYACIATPSNICSSNENTNPQFSGGAWYTAMGMVPTRDEATRYSVDTSLNDLELRLVRRPTARGTITFPTALAANTTFPSFQVSLHHYNSINDFPNFPSDSWSQSYIVDNGATEFTYFQPSSFVDSGFYTIQVSCNFDCDDYVDKAYYHSSGSVSKISTAEQIPFDADLNNRDFSMLQGQLLSLTLKLPGNAVPQAGFSPSIVVQKLDAGGSVEVVYSATRAFSTSDNRKTYSLRVPADETGGGYRIYYQCFSECKNYYPKAYYTSTGSELEEIDADIIPYDASLSGIEITMIRGQRFDGLLKFPGSVVASELTPNRISATLLDSDCKPMATYHSTNLAISAGNNSRAYTVDIPLMGQSGYQIEYSCLPENICASNGYEDNGWVGATMIEAAQEQATFFATNNVPDSLDITIIDAVTEGNNPVYSEIGGKCSVAVCVPIKSSNGSVAIICL